MYSEKAENFCEIFPLLLTTVHTVKSKGKISQNFVVFSEYMNFVKKETIITYTVCNAHHNSTAYSIIWFSYVLFDKTFCWNVFFFQLWVVPIIWYSYCLVKSATTPEQYGAATVYSCVLVGLFSVSTFFHIVAARGKDRFVKTGHQNLRLGWIS